MCIRSSATRNAPKQTNGDPKHTGRLPDKRQEALAHFYSERATSVLLGFFDALAERPLRINVHHLHRMWQACVYFGRKVRSHCLWLRLASKRWLAVSTVPTQPALRLLPSNNNATHPIW